MKVLLLLVLTIISMHSASAGEAFFRPESRKHIDIKEGDSFKGVIEIWNVENISPQMIAQLRGNTFLDHFYVVSIQKPTWSENNPQVVVIPGTFILQKSLETVSKSWKHGGLEIPVTIKEIATKSLVEKKKGFVVLDGNYKFSEASSNLKLYISLAVFLSLALVFVIYKKRKKKVVIKTKRKEDWKGILKKAKNKDDFSYIYLNRKKWAKKVINKEITMASFLKCSESHLFKKELEDFELEELKISIDSVLKGMVD